MRVSAYSLVAFSGLLLTASIISIVLLLDDGAQRAISKVVGSLQERTLALSVESASREVLKIIPLVEHTLIQYETGFGDPRTMSKVDLRFYFEENTRVLMRKVSPFVYYSQITLPNTWQDSNCVWVDTDVTCVRPGSHPTIAYEEQYPSVLFPMDPSNFTSVPANYTEEYYEQRIASLTRADVNGSWSAPYYFLDQVSSEKYALQTFSVPLEFNEQGTCVKATSADVSLVDVATALKAARASSASVLFIIDPAVGKIVATSDTETTLWDECGTSKPVLWDFGSFPQRIVREAAVAFTNRMDADLRLNAPHGHFSQFEMTSGGTRYLVATMHMRHKDLHWLLVDVTPRSFYYSTLDDARIVSTTIGGSIGFVALCVTLACFVIIIRHLHSLGNEMDKVATLAEESDTPENGENHSYLYEVGRLQDSFIVMKRSVDSFCSYVPREVVRLLLKDGTLATLGMNSVKTTISFTDIANFTAMCQNINATQLNSLIRIYFETMSDIVMAYGGVVDKYIGDCIMALWGTPTPIDSVNMRACAAALTMRYATTLRRMSQAFRKAGCMQLRIRTGIHHGNCLAGNMGTRRRLNYTVVGDAVNLAARMEAMNKDFGTNILITEDVVVEERLHTTFVLRLLGNVQAVGRTVPTKVYELVGAVPESSVESVEAAPPVSPNVGLRASDIDEFVSAVFERRKSVLPDDESSEFVSRFRQMTEQKQYFPAAEILPLLHEGAGKCSLEAVRYAAGFSEAMEAYLAREFHKAATLFRTLGTGDRHHERMILTCEAFVTEPPDMSWTGMFASEHK